jgi:ABC-2 type transport system ATP-binding protein
MENVTVRFGDLEAVKDITLTVAKGSILGVIGPSGAGKTTTIRILTGALEPTKGKAVVLGEDPRRFHRRTRERIGYMPQQFTLYPDLTAGENVDFVASLFGLLWRRRRQRVKDVLHLVELWDARGRRAADLSGGMQRRLELASALVHEPELLFLDEPTAGIDPLLRGRIWDELHRLKEAGRTLIVTTQYVNEAEECDAVALIAQGRLVALATPDDLRRQATGGDIIEIETAKAFDARSLEGTPLVNGVHQMTPRSMRVVVAEAGSATPTIVRTLNEAGAEVVSAGEYRLTFDEVFAALVARGQERAAAEDRAATAHDRNEAQARQLVNHELERRRKDSRTTPLDERAEAAERERLAAHAEAAGQAEAARTAGGRTSDPQPPPATESAPERPRTMDDQARNLPPGDDPAGLDSRPADEAVPSDVVRQDDRSAGR